MAEFAERLLLLPRQTMNKLKDRHNLDKDAAEISKIGVWDNCKNCGR
jgi:hypothetical protein